MSKARNLADVISGAFDVPAGALDNVEGLPDAIDVNASAPADSLNIDASGNVTVGSSGTTTPTYDYSTLGEGLHLRYWDQSGARHADIVATGNTPAGATQDLRLFTNSGGSPGTATERMRIDSSGNVGIGTSSPKTELSVDGSAISGFNASAFGWQHYQQASSTYTATEINSELSGASSFLSFKTNGNWTNGNAVERMSLQSNGRMVFKSPSNTGANYQDARIDWRNENNAGVMTRIACYREGSQYAPAALTFHTTNNVDTTANNSDGNISEKFRIASNGDLTATDTSISSNSDQRLKQNIQDFGYDLETFKQLQTHTFDWKEPHLHGDKSGVRGFVAQELEALDPYWVQEIEVPETSDDYQYLPDTNILYGENNPYKPEDASATDIERTARFAKTSKLGQKDAMYVSVIQQLLAKIETLETTVADLQTRVTALEA